MKPSDLRKILVKLIPAREPFLLKGSPGIGKTDIIRQVAASLNYDCIVTHPVVDDPTDYKGMPAIVASNAGPRAEFLPFAELARLVNANGPTLVFFDDLGQAPPAVQAAIMQLVLARRINGHEISPLVTFAAATNRRQDRAAVTGMIAPLLDRFTTVLTVDFCLEDWIAWGIQNDVPAELLAFVRFRPNAIGRTEPNATAEPDQLGSGNTDRPRVAANKDMVKCPTPRSVAGLGRLVNAGILEPEVLTGAVGEAFAIEFLAFYQTWHLLPDRTSIYLNPDGVEVPQKPDVLYALMGSLAHGATATTFDATVRFLSRVPPEFSVACIKDAIARNKGLTHTRAFQQWACANAAVFSYDPAVAA